MRFNFPVSLPVCVPMQRWCSERFPQMHGQTPAVPVQQPHVVMFPSPARPQVTPLLRKMSHGRAGRRGGSRRGPPLMRLAMSVFQSRPVNKMDETSLSEAPFPPSCVNTVASLSVLLNSVSCYRLPPPGSGSKACLPFIPAQDPRELVARSMCCVRPDWKATWMGDSGRCGCPGR